MAKKQKPVIKTNIKEEIIKTIAVVMIVLAIIMLVYLLTSFLTKKGAFKDEYVPLSTPEAVLTYEDATVGTSLNRPDKEYYVVFEDFGNENKTYINTILNEYTSQEKYIPVYKVDMTLKVNEKYASKVGNKDAKKIEDFKIKTPTMIHVKNGAIVDYIETNANIKDELD